MAAVQKEQGASVAVIGGGLAGSLVAVVLGQRGYNVDVFEKREDSRADSFQWEGRSINLALSVRGRKALRKAGLEDLIVSKCIPMNGRVMHDLSGKLTYMPYSSEDECLYSCSRQMLNEELMTRAEKHPNVRFHFNVGCKNFNLNNTSFQATVKDEEPRTVQPQYIVGTDGSYSVVRSALEHRKGVNYQQVYLDHGYKELTIPPRNGDYALFTNALHIWPRGDFMMIALPNQDKSFTVTLFMPWEGENGFNQIKTPEQLLAFFKSTFPDALPLMPTLMDDYFSNPTGHLITIKCEPWNYKNTVILGDAAHAIVPFYGQGMNASLEDVDVLDDLLEEAGSLAHVLPTFYQKRKPAGDAVAKLSLDNYIEMRSKVTSRIFLLRRSLENVIHRMMPRVFIPLYDMVAFTSIPYHEVIERNQKQTRIMDRIFTFSSLALGVAVVLGIPPLRRAFLGAVDSVYNSLHSLR